MSKKPIHNSIWGSEDVATVQALKTQPIKGKWLNLCAGDGRFNSRLLEKAEDVVAFDCDEEALAVLLKNTPTNLHSKLIIQKGNLDSILPFESESFDGIFCTGTLHLFPELLLRHSVSEINRLLKSGGIIILDFATDIKREQADGKLYIVPNEPHHALAEGIELLKNYFSHYEIDMIISEVPAEKIVGYSKTNYIFSSNFILLIGKKP